MGNKKKGTHLFFIVLTRLFPPLFALKKGTDLFFEGAHHISLAGLTPAR